MSNGCDAINACIVLMSIDVRPARTVYSIPFMNSLKMALYFIFGQWESTIVCVVKLESIRDRTQLCSRLSLC